MSAAGQAEPAATPSLARPTEAERRNRPREPLPASVRASPPAARWQLSLFTRTFLLLAMLLAGSILAWLQIFRQLELKPINLQNAQQIASLVNLSRSALNSSDAINRVTLIKAMADQEGLRVEPREPRDVVEPFDGDDYGQRVAQAVAARLGSDTLVARAVNGRDGLWVGFNLGGDRYWLSMESDRLARPGSQTWLVWLLSAAVLSLVGAALIASRINRPLTQLSFAASRVRDGQFDASHLDEHVATSEIREVNIGFNRMATQLAKVEQERAVMLAGISHDLRTPLTRLRLETEMSVADPGARAHMAADIDQLDAIIDKFLDYARPEPASMTPVLLNDVVQACIYAVEERKDVRVNASLPRELQVMGDAVDIARVLDNLIENARRYGKTPETGMADIDIAAHPHQDMVVLTVRDHGIGVAPASLQRLKQPFFRGDAARTAATGAGLGLAIVEKTVQRMGGTLELHNAADHGLLVVIRLKRPV